MPRIPAVLPANVPAASQHVRQPGPLRGTIKGLAVAFLLASATGAGAQETRNGPEWGGKDHQPTQSEVIQRERQAGVRAPKGQVDQNDHTVDQLDQQLLHDESVDPPRRPNTPAPPYRLGPDSR